MTVSSYPREFEVSFVGGGSMTVKVDEGAMRLYAGESAFDVAAFIVAEQTSRKIKGVVEV